MSRIIELHRTTVSSHNLGRHVCSQTRCQSTTTRISLNDKPQSLDVHRQAAMHCFDCSQPVEKAPSASHSGIAPKVTCMQVISQKRLNFIVPPKRHPNLLYSIYWRCFHGCLQQALSNIVQTPGTHYKSSAPWLRWHCPDLVHKPLMAFDPRHAQPCRGAVSRNRRFGGPFSVSASFSDPEARIGSPQQCAKDPHVSRYRVACILRVVRAGNVES